MTHIKHYRNFYFEFYFDFAVNNYVTKKSNSNKNEKPQDWYSYIILRLKDRLKIKLESLEKGTDLYERIKRLNDFMWTREIFKKVIMTYPYNTSLRTKINYIKESESLILVDTIIKDIENFDDNKSRSKNKKDINKKNKLYQKNNIKIVTWYRTKESEDIISSEDIRLLVDYIEEVIINDSSKISKLIRYLRNVARICNALKVPIIWGLPTGLEIHQSYLETESEPIQVFEFSKKVLKFSILKKPISLNKDKQIRALMPNLIHSLDATTMFLLYHEFTNNYGENTNLYTIHDCFATTSDKSKKLITVIWSIYTNLYSNNQYLRDFDQGILNTIKDNLRKEVKWNLEKRELRYKGRVILLHDVEWVLGEKLYDPKHLEKIDGQYIVNL